MSYTKKKGTTKKDNVVIKPDNLKLTIIPKLTIKEIKDGEIST